MDRKHIISAFVRLGECMKVFGSAKVNEENTLYDQMEAINQIIKKQQHFNGWFTEENVRLSLHRIGNQLNEKSLSDFLNPYSYASAPKRIGIIMAGNIPLVGFHDFLCVVLSGNIAVCKLSSEDKTLLPLLVNLLVSIEPNLKDRIEISFGPIKNIEAVIATGSDNSIKYFQQYFGQLPHVFRNNRTSVAVIEGDETKEEFERLGEDIFTYFGLGCRNVSHLLFPKSFNLDLFFEGIYKFHPIVNHNKYGNNYDFQKTVHLMNKIPILDNNFVLLKETLDLHSPLGMIHYHFYDNKKEIEDYFNANKNQIQAIVGKNYIPFGQGQCPLLNDFADGIDTLQWLRNLS